MRKRALGSPAWIACLGVVFAASAAFGAQKVSVMGQLKTGKVLSADQLQIAVKGNGAAKQAPTSYPAIFKVEGNKVEFSVAWSKGSASVGAILPENQDYVSLLIVIDEATGTASARVVDSFSGNPANIGSYNVPSAAQQQVIQRLRMDSPYGRTVDVSAAQVGGCTAAELLTLVAQPGEPFGADLIACNDGVTTLATQWAQSFAVPGAGAQSLQCFDIGVAQADADTDVTLTVYTDATPATGPSTADLTVVGSTSTTIPAGTFGMYTIDLSGAGISVNGGDQMVFEVQVPALGHLFFLATSGDAGDGPSYILAPDCGAADYLDIGAAGFPGAQWEWVVGLGAPVVVDGACCDTMTGTCAQSTNVDCEGDFTEAALCADVTCDISIPGDTCDNCIGIAPGDSLLANNTGAGDNGTTTCDFGGAEIDQWFCYTATCDGEATASTCAAATEAGINDTILGVFDSCGGAEIICNDDDDTCAEGDFHSTATWAITSGSTYAISVSGWGNTGEGEYQLSLSETCVGPCGPGAGACDAPNGTPGCDDVACCEAICAADSFCCDTEWDQICADAAAVDPTCTGASGDGGTDNCVDGPEAIAGEGTFPFNNAAATTDGPVDVLCEAFGEQGIDNDVWFCWTNTCANAGNVTVQSCGLTGVDTRIAAYNGCDCPVGPDTAAACNDDTCGLQSLITIASNPGDTHLIRVGTFPGAAGGTGSISIACPIDTGNLPCNEPPANCQDYDLANASQSNDTAFTSYDDFSPDADGDITSICWWGAYIPAIAGDNFRVDYYEDSGGLPGAQIGSFSGASLTVTGPEDTGDLVAAQAPIYEYTGEHAAVSVTAGNCYWISIVNNADGGATWFWSDSLDPNGNGQRIVDAGPDGPNPGDGVFGLDFAFCINGALGDNSCPPVPLPECPQDIFPGCGDPGAGDCLTANGTPFCANESCCCTVCDLDAFCCDTEWDQICADAAATLDPCLGPQGACCFDDGTCNVTSEDTCNSNGGSWLGENTTCDQCPAAARCCTNDGGCAVLTETACEAAGGLFIADEVDCSQATGPSTTYDGAGALAIPDGDPAGISQTITVGDSFNVAEVEVSLDVTHTWIGDICATLEHNGTSVTVVQRIGEPGLGCAGGCCACDGDNMSLDLDDDAGMVPPCPGDGTGPNGLFLPAEALSAFDGMDSAGDWTLTIADNAAQDTGSLDAWSITLSEPAGGGDELCPAFGACCCIGDCFVTTEDDCIAQNGNFLEGENCDLPPGDTTTLDGAGFDIPDGDPAGASDTVAMGMSFPVQDINISLDVTHTWIGDLCATVEHNGTSVTVLQRVGEPGLGCAGGCCACDGDDLSLDFDDSAAAAPACPGDGTGPVGVVLPQEALSAFNGMDSAGDWTITVADNAAQDTGSVTGWSVSIQAPGMGEGICENNCCGDGVVSGAEECDPPDGECCQADCTFAPTGTACGDGSDGECTNPDTCSSAGVCLDNDAPAGTPCGTPPNGEECFLGDFCSGGGVCQTGALETECGDGIDGCCPAGCNFANDADCPEPVPTVSQWGLLILALLLAAAAKVYFSRRESVA